jgi:hypothetical protein
MAAEIVVPQDRKLCPVIALIAAALAGCAPPPDVVGLEQDPGFKYEALSAAPMAVLGMTVEGMEPTSASASLQLGGLLAERLTRKRRDLSFLPAMHVADSLGLRDYTRLMREYQDSGRLDDTALVRLAEALSGVRYVLLARLEVHELETGRSVDNYSEEREGRTCDVEQTSKFAVRTLAVHFTVYDLHQRRTAWTGQITDFKERTSGDAWNSCDSLLFNLVTMLANADPDPPELAEVLRKVFDDFARHLPRA